MLATTIKTTLRQVDPLTDRAKSLFLSCLGEGLRWLILFPLLRLFVRIKIVGAENLAKGQAYIFAANHSSHLDAPVFLAALPLSLRRRVRIAAAADYFFSRHWSGVLVRTVLNAFPFERRQPGSSVSLDYAQKLLRQDHSILIFPEGTRSSTGAIQPFKRGVGTLARSARVVPIWIDGTFTALPKGSHWPRRGQVTVIFGVPVSFDPSREAAVIAAEIEQQVRTLAFSSSIPLHKRKS